MLAIIIPYYKITFFEATLNSLANQTDKRFKVYIGDDASPQDPLPLLQALHGKFDYYYKKFEDNLGGKSLVKQWKRCIEMAAGEEWLIILGDDDLLGPNCVSEFYRQRDKIEEWANVVRFSAVVIDDFGKEISAPEVNVPIQSVIEFFFKKRRSSLSESVFRKAKLVEIGFKDFPLAWFSDVLALLEFSDFGQIYSINEAQVYIRVSSESISGQTHNIKLKYRAEFEFYAYLITKRGTHFSLEQKKVLMKKLENCYFNNKGELDFLFGISKIYLSKGLWMDYLYFLGNTVKRVIAVIQKRK